MYEIRKLDRSDTDFYALMGPIFGSRRIAKEIGINVYDDSDKQFFAIMGDGFVIGILSVRGSAISDCYTVPNYRRKGMLDALLFTAVSGMNYAKATCTPASRGVFEKAGFKPIKELKNFTIMEYKKNA